MDPAEILRTLPHRYPFVMVDGVESVDAETIRAFKLVSLNEPQFRGHFPEMPVMPGVLLLEGLAQSAALLAHHRGDFDPGREQLWLVSADKVKFRQPVGPGTRLDYHVRVVRGGKVWRGVGEIYAAGKRVASAEFTAAIRPREGVFRG